MSDNDKSSETKQPSNRAGAAEKAGDGVIIDAAGDQYEVSDDRKTIGLTSAVFLCVNLTKTRRSLRYTVRALTNVGS